MTSGGFDKPANKDELGMGGFGSLAATGLGLSKTVEMTEGTTAFGILSAFDLERGCCIGVDVTIELPNRLAGPGVFNSKKSGAFLVIGLGGC